MNSKELKKFTSWLGKQSYKARLGTLGIERIREIARENGKQPCHPGKKRGRPTRQRSGRA
jgi:hypothetical protein